MAKATRRCLSCKTDISARGNKSVRCKPCQVAFRELRERAAPDRPICADDDGTCSLGRLKRGRCPRHYYTARRDNGLVIPQTPRACVTCGLVFTPVRSDAVACSALCNWRKQDRAARVNYPVRYCVTCGTPYKPKRGDARYCKIDCIANPSARAVARWVAQNRAAVSITARRRQQMLVSSPDSVGVSKRDWSKLVNRYGGRCAYCGVKPETITVDHVVPVNRGGRHSIGNVLPACGSCNSAKRDVFLAEFRRRMRFDEGRRWQVAEQQCQAAEHSHHGSGGPHGPLRYEQLTLELCG